MAFDPLHLQVLTPAEILLQADGVDWVQTHLGDEAPIGIYPGHAPLLAKTKSAPLRYADAGGEHAIDLSAGILQVADGQVTIFTWKKITQELEEEADESGDAAAEDARFDRLARDLLIQLQAQPGTILESDEEAI